MQATLDWSHGLLSPTDATVFRRLGVFTAGFTLEAASKVAADDKLDEFAVIDGVASLVAKSLVLADVDGAQSRYRLLETTRMYALEQLAAAGETAAVQRRHAVWFTEFASQSLPDYCGKVSDEAFYIRYIPDLPNTEKALTWAFGPDGDDEIGIALTAGSFGAWTSQSAWLAYIPWGEVALSRCTPQTPEVTVAELKAALVSAYTYGNNPPRASQLGQELLPYQRTVAKDEITRNALLNTLINVGAALRLQGRTEEAKRFLDEALRVAADLPPSRLTLGAITGRGYLDGDSDPTHFIKAIEAAEPIARDIGADGWLALLAGDRLSLKELEGNVVEVEAVRQLLESIKPHYMFFSFLKAMLSSYLVYLLAKRNGPGDLAEAWPLAGVMEKIFGRYIPPRFLPTYIQLAASDGRPEDAARLHGAAVEQTARDGVDFVASKRNEAEGLALLKPLLGDSELTALMAEGAKLTPDQVFDLAMKRQDPR